MSVPGFIYGIDVSRFRDADGDGLGDLRGVIEKLDYVAGLGATWIWLLPFYPSARRDNGYDVDDHRRVDPRLGTMADFARTHRGGPGPGLRVMLDLCCITPRIAIPGSSPRSRAIRGSRASTSGATSPCPPSSTRRCCPARSIPRGRPPERGQWYRHGFYHYEPDLNYQEPEVREAAYRVAEFWTDAGADGFRIDAASHIVDVPGEGLASLSFFDEFRARLDARRPGMVLMGEANVPAPAGGSPARRSSS